ncbi:MAG: CAP domain-containing protein [Cytophagales bacterium]|nr:CAP domain-containing protein [Cytophagales bacterium]MDW8383932.1 CAP domain-containing protein [Flammeovirgaceae bacterium]
MMKWIVWLFFTYPVAAQLTVYTIDGCSRCNYIVSRLRQNNIQFVECNTSQSQSCDNAFNKVVAHLNEENFTMPLITDGKKIWYNITSLSNLIDEIVQEYKEKKIGGASPQENLKSVNPYKNITPKGFSDEEMNQAYFILEKATYLSEEEKKVIYFCNLARLNGKVFADAIVKPYAEKYPTSNSAYVKSLIADLLKTGTLAVYRPSESLSKAAKYHAEDMGKNGLIGHKSSNGKSFFERISLFHRGNMSAENCSYGVYDPMEIVVYLLIDEGIESKGHRNNILNRNYSFIGVGIAPHSVYGTNCVMDFSDTE